ncbi:cation efflux family protein [Niveomyces insectorum RCEF 264]|uniref:Cation efflux family protein n=1 Tax=Niveomyces insectorum RCEF 264 TaxID=1081102 RepID=A0A167X4U2_9HYPO|nr:cation efflux family protein [Niveomyces insectorum RCEF 264]
MEPDLSASITRHPHPFRLEHSAPSRSSSRPPTSPAPGIGDGGDQTPSSNSNNNNNNNNYDDDDKGNNASSTGVEIKAEQDDATVERHPSVHPSGSPSALGPPSSPAADRLSDIESQTTAGAGGSGRLPRYSAETDPYGLSSAYKTDQDLAALRPTGARKRRVSRGMGGGNGPTGEGDGDGSGDGAGSSSDSDSSGRSGGTAVGAGETGRSGHNGSNNRGGTNRGSGGGSSSSKQRHGLLAQCLPPALVALLSSVPLALPALPALPFAARRAVRTRKLRGFYRSQNAVIENMLKTVEQHQAEARQEAGEDQLRYRIAVYGSFVANLVLAGLQIYGAVSSGSLSLFTTMADAIFDPLSNVTLIVTNRAVRRVDPARFPSGKARLETVGNIVFCFLMTAVSFILIAFSVRELAEGRPARAPATNTFHLASVLAVAVAFLTKLALFVYTWTLKDRYSQVSILWKDHRNDLLINGFGLLTSVGGSKLVWWIDPAGAVVLGVVVSAIWLRTAFAEFLLLVGVVAAVETQQLITYVCLTHSPAVRQIDTVRVYHSGPRLIAEVDVVMPREATLGETHDVAEALQSKLECLPDVERAYVHVDYETTHKPEHAFKKDL